MGKKDKESLEELEGATTAPPPPPGPLAPWRLSIAVAVSAALTGLPLYDAAMTGLPVDMALLRSFGVAFVVFIALGFVNRVLVQAQLDADADSDVDAGTKAGSGDISPKPYVDDRGGDVGSSAA